MSINLENPDTVLGMVDAAANYVSQIRLALGICPIAHPSLDHAMKCAEQAERLLFNATCKIEEDQKSANDQAQRPKAL